MTRFSWLPAVVFAGASCTPVTTQSPAPAPAPAPPPAQTVVQIPSSAIRRPNPPKLLPPWHPDSTAIALGDRVPPFQTQPLIEWGPLPTGAPHAERVRTYDLTHQVVHVSFDWSRQATVGSTTVTIAGLAGSAPLPTVSLDAEGMKIKAVSAGGAPLRYGYDGHSISIQLPTPLRAGAQTTFSVSYEAATRRKGAYFNARKHVVWTQGETEDTRYWIPTYDYPNDKTTWEFFIRTAKNERALSNGRLADSAGIGTDSVEWHWMQERPASTYLMTTVVGNYEVTHDRPANGASIGYWTYPDSIDAARRGFAHTPEAVELFSAKTGVPYPWPKYDQIVIPDFQFGGMENVTATSQNDAEILYPVNALPQAHSGGLMSHELGHQWYGDLLTIRRWDDIWLNEGFATFMEQIFTEADQGRDQGAYDRMQAYERVVLADRNARRPLVYGRWMRNPFELFFSGHIYPKGAAVLQMLRHQLGDDVFWKAMHRYTVDHAYANVVTDDLRLAFEQTTGRDFKAFFKQWVYGAGLPVFCVSSLYDKAMRRVVIQADEIQPRDELTGFFDADVDVEIRTDSGIVNMVLPVRNGTGRLGVNVKSPPRSVRWNKGGWLLEIHDFPRSTNMLADDLTHDDDGERATRGLLAWSSASTRDPASPRTAAVKLAVLDASRDVDARVRQAAAGILYHFPGVETSARARDLVNGDSNPYVRGEALAAYVRLEGQAALPLVRQILPQDSWANVIRTPVLEALAELNTAEARALIQKYAPPVLTLFLTRTHENQHRILHGLKLRAQSRQFGG